MFFSGSRRAIEMISASTSSTTLRVLENGALNTATPRLLAAARSIWLTPMQNAPIAASCGAAASTRSVTCVPDGLDELVLAERPGQRLDGEALLGQPRRRVGMDVLDQKGPGGHQRLHLSRS